MFDLPEKPTSDLLLEIDYGAMPNQQINVYVNDNPLLQDFPINTDGPSLAFYIPLELVQDSKRVLIRLEFPDATSPKALESNEDERVLAMRFTGLKLSSTDET